MTAIENVSLDSSLLGENYEKLILEAECLQGRIFVENVQVVCKQIEKNRLQILDENERDGIADYVVVFNADGDSNLKQKRNRRSTGRVTRRKKCSNVESNSNCPSEVKKMKMNPQDDNDKNEDDENFHSDTTFTLEVDVKNTSGKMYESFEILFDEPKVKKVEMVEQVVEDFGEFISCFCAFVPKKFFLDTALFRSPIFLFPRLD